MFCPFAVDVVIYLSVSAKASLIQRCLKFFTGRNLFMYVIRPLKKENIQFVFELMCETDNVSALHTKVLSFKEWENFFAETEKDKDEENFIVFSEEKPCAWLKLNGLMNKDIAWISMLVVSDDFKRCGVGKFAVDFSLRYLRQRGFGEIKLHTTQDNFVAIKFYEKCGFVVTESKTWTADDGTDTIMLTMRKTNFDFISVPAENHVNHKKLCRAYVKYKRKSLRNQGEYPLGKKVFRKLFCSMISESSSEIKSDNPNHFVVMKNEKNIIGFTSISTNSKYVVDVTYAYGEVKDFYISPEFRRKGYGRKLNEYVENIFIRNGTNVVLLSPDPVSGIDFWKAMGYSDTVIHQGLGKHFVYKKHLRENENSAEFDKAIQGLVAETDLISINPYNKNQIKEATLMLKKYCEENKLKFRKSDVKKMAFRARNNESVSFKALYYSGKIIGLIYCAEEIVKYILPEYRKFEEALMQ